MQSKYLYLDKCYMVEIDSASIPPKYRIEAPKTTLVELSLYVSTSVYTLQRSQNKVLVLLRQFPWILVEIQSGLSCVSPHSLTFYGLPYFSRYCPIGNYFVKWSYYFPHDNSHFLNRTINISHTGDKRRKLWIISLKNKLDIVPN